MLRASISSGKHDITIFTRREPTQPLTPGVSYKQIDYHDRAVLTAALQGFDVCLSFIVAHLDENCVMQKNLIHACIDAGVKRFAPSEWSIKNDSPVAAYANKDVIARYLADLKEKGQLNGMEYSLFQTSVFMDYFAHPYPLSPGLHTWPFFADFENRRAMLLDQGQYPFALTAIADVSSMLQLALEDDKPWPVISGMRGARTTMNELLALGKEIRGGEWTVDHVKSEDILKGELKTSWVPPLTHPIIPVDKRETFSREFVISFFRAILQGSWDVSDECNRRHPEFKFTELKEYLTKAWDGRP